MGKWVLIATGVVVVTAVIAILLGQARENSKARQMVATLTESANPSPHGRVAFEEFAELPPPVARYFRHVLSDG